MRIQAIIMIDRYWTSEQIANDRKITFPDFKENGIDLWVETNARIRF